MDLLSWVMLIFGYFELWVGGVGCFADVILGCLDVNCDLGFVCT